MPVYFLTVAKGGPRLTESKPELIHYSAEGKVIPHVKRSRGGSLEVEGETMEKFAEALSQFPDVGRFVVDKTGLTGVYHVVLQRAVGAAAADPSVAGDATIFTALQEQLGLKLEPGKAPVDVLVIDHAERPTPN